MNLKYINCLLVFNEELEIVEFINSSAITPADNKWEEGLYYTTVELELFFKLKELSLTNKIKLTKNPIKEKIGIGDIEKTPLPPKPPTPEEITNKAILEQTMAISGLTETANDLSAKTQCLADGLMQGISKQSTLEQKVNVLSKALLEIAMKGMK